MLSRPTQIDHINDDGFEDNKKFNRDPLVMRRYYIKHPEEAKKRLQVFCANCNSIKRFENGNVNQWNRLNGGDVKK